MKLPCDVVASAAGSSSLTEADADGSFHTARHVSLADVFTSSMSLGGSSFCCINRKSPLDAF